LAPALPPEKKKEIKRKKNDCSNKEVKEGINRKKLRIRDHLSVGRK
jgi:hypothetical protein